LTAGHRGPALPGARGTFSLARLREYWAVRSLSAGAFSSTVDLMVLVLLVERAHLPAVVATALAVAAGAAVNFLLNKYVAFRDPDPQVVRQAARFATGVGVSMLFHAALVYTLTQRFGLHYLFAKLLADGLIFTFGNLALNRYIVFPENSRLGREAGRALACLSLVAVLVGGPILPSHPTGQPALDASHQSRDCSTPELQSIETAESQPILVQTVIALLDGNAGATRFDEGPRLSHTAPVLGRLRRPPKA
jgi:putative flippase GtrA